MVLLIDEYDLPYNSSLVSDNKEKYELISNTIAAMLRLGIK